MRIIHSLFVASIVSLAISLPAAAGPASKPAAHAIKPAPVKSAGTDVNRGGDLNMVRLQSSVSQRQMTIQMTQRIARSTDTLKNCPACFR